MRLLLSLLFENYRVKLTHLKYHYNQSLPDTKFLILIGLIFIVSELDVFFYIIPKSKRQRDRFVLKYESKQIIIKSMNC